MSIGKVYVARVGDINEAFDQSTHAREDLKVFSLRLNQSRGNFATADLTIENPTGGIRNGSPFVLISVEVDGVPTLIARGKIVNYPIGLAGSLISVEVACRPDSYKSELDNLWSTLDGYVPEELERIDRKRRAEKYSLKFPLRDPASLQLSLEDIIPSSSPYRVFRGDGSAFGDSDILSVSVSLVRPPISSTDLEISADWHQKRVSFYDVGPEIISSFPPSLGDVRTLTPRAVEESLAYVRSGGGSSYSVEFSGLELTPGQVRKVSGKTDPSICLRKFWNIQEYEISDLAIVFRAEMNQSRSESLSVKIESDLQDIGGESTESDSMTVGSAHRRMSRTTNYARGIDGRTASFSVKHYPERSFFARVSDYASGNIDDIIKPCVLRSAKKMISSAYCVEVSIEVPFSEAFDISISHNLRVEDSRLPGGYAEGFVYSVSSEISDSATSSITIMCCPGLGTDPDPLAESFGGVSILFPQSVENSGNVVYTTAESRIDLSIVKNVFAVGDADSQLNEIQANALSSKIVADPRDSATPTRFEVELYDLQSENLDTVEHVSAPARIYLKAGIQI